jgi:hypothetical protein
MLAAHPDGALSGAFIWNVPAGSPPSRPELLCGSTPPEVA